nr:Epoxyqueuosine reductase [Klebsiella pneumoniae]
MTEGSAIRRIGHLRWLRNIAVALGNAPWMKPIFAPWRAAGASTRFSTNTLSGRLPSN